MKRIMITCINCVLKWKISPVNSVQSIHHENTPIDSWKGEWFSWKIVEKKLENQPWTTSF